MDNEPLHLSLLSQYGFCTRRAALILLEDAWQDNQYTAKGTLAHERVHSKGHVKRGNVVMLYGCRVYSHALGLSGQCDCIEAILDEDGVEIPYYPGRFRLYPIEYKHGVVRDEKEYNMQLCAQAMCLEEMYGGMITRGAIFYHDSHRRIEIALDAALRQDVKNTAKALADLRESQEIPAAEFCAKCRKCSIYSLCLPKTKKTAKSFNARVRAAAIEGETQ